MNHKQERQLTDSERRKLNRERVDKEKVYSFTGGLNGKKKTRRGKKKQPEWVSIRKKEQTKEMKEYNKLKRERWLQYKEFRRKII